ncbi:MAG: hypothetical protein ACI85O_002396 [Saprospiraceae bacterium]|jgi:hypothetical protein
MKKVVLFPFNIEEDNKDRYTKAVNFARKNEADLVLFTALQQEVDERIADEVYFHLLELNGHFQVQNGWQSIAELKTERKIIKGEFYENLENVVNEKMPSWIIGSGYCTSFDNKKIKELVNPEVRIVPVIL